MTRFQRFSCCLLLVLDFNLLLVTFGILIENVPALLLLAFGFGLVHGQVIRAIWSIEPKFETSFTFFPPDELSECRCCELEKNPMRPTMVMGTDYSAYDQRDFTPSLPDILVPGDPRRPHVGE